MNKPPTPTSLPHQPAARLQDVAHRAGVTKSIASRILNSAPVAVREETRERVMSVARELGYRPNPAARALSRSATGMVALVVPDLGNAVYPRIVRGAVRAAAAADLAVLVVEDDPEANALGSLLGARRVDGVVMLAARPGHPDLPRLLEGATPCVFAHRGVAGSGRNVTIDDAHAIELAVRHLHALGHRRIGHVGGPEGFDTAERRADGFSACAGELELPLAPIERTRYDEAAAAAAARRLLERHGELTAIVTASFPQAIGVRAAAAQLGLDVPGRLSLVAYDDVPLADFVQPALTTVRVPLEELGATALGVLRDQLAGEPAREHVIATPPEIIVRHSTAEAP